MIRYSYERVAVQIPQYSLVVCGSRKQAEGLARLLEKGIQQSADICQVSPAVCRENLGISRSKMPQLEDSVARKFLESYKRFGIKVQRGSIPVGKLKATQREINAAKAIHMAREFTEGRFPNITDSVIVSKDNYILDGHHRWAALLIVDPKKSINVYKVDLPIRRLLDDARNFGGVGFAGFDAPSGAAGFA